MTNFGFLFALPKKVLREIVYEGEGILRPVLFIHGRRIEARLHPNLWHSSPECVAWWARGWPKGRQICSIAAARYIREHKLI